MPDGTRSLEYSQRNAGDRMLADITSLGIVWYVVAGFRSHADHGPLHRHRVLDGVNRRLGDRSWHELRQQHDATVRTMLARYWEVEQNNGDGFFATFDGPARRQLCPDSRRMPNGRRLGLLRVSLSDFVFVRRKCTKNLVLLSHRHCE